MDISEGEFERLAERELACVEAAVEAAADAGAVEVEVERGAAGVLELTFDDDSQMIINAHRAAREIWVAARAGGFHFRPRDGGGWADTRSGEDLWAALARLIGEQAGLGGPVSLG